MPHAVPFIPQRGEGGVQVLCPLFGQLKYKGILLSHYWQEFMA